MATNSGNFGVDWFWSNYKKCINWRSKHEVAYWKSQALSLSSENERLLQIIHDSKMKLDEMDSKMKTPSPKKSKRKSLRRLQAKRKKNKAKRNLRVRERLQASESSGDLVLEVSDELLEFFKISCKHREERQKEKEEQQAIECDFKPPQEELDSRIEQMKELYGEGFTKILGMETSMNLSFDRYKDQKTPDFWPTLPLNL